MNTTKELTDAIANSMQSTVKDMSGSKRRSIFDYSLRLVGVMATSPAFFYSTKDLSNGLIISIILILSIVIIYVAICVFDYKSFDKNAQMHEEDDLRKENLAECKELFKELKTLIIEDKKDEIQRLLDIYVVHGYISVIFNDTLNGSVTTRVIEISYETYSNKLAYKL